MKEEEKKEEESASISALIQTELAKLTAQDESSIPTPPNVPKAPTINLKSILKRAKNST